MTASTLERAASRAARGELLAPLDAADRDVRNEASSGVTALELLEIFRHLDDSLADWLGLPVDNEIIACGGSLSGTDVLRAPLLKAAICSTV